MRKILQLVVCMMAASMVLCSCSEKPEPSSGKRMVPPSQLRSEADNDNALVTLKWKDNATGEKSYTILQKNGSAEEVVATVEANATEWTSAALDYDKEYYFGVRADGVDASKNSLVGWFDLIVLNDPLGAPKNLGISQSSSNKRVITLTWSDVAEKETGYAIYQKTTENPQGEVIANLPKNSTSYSVPFTLKWGVTYSFGIQTLGEEKNSTVAWFEPITVVNDNPVIEEDPNSPVKITDIFSTQTAVSVTYSIAGISNVDSYGVCFSDGRLPDLTDTYQMGGPSDVFTSTSTTIHQMISNVLLDYGSEFNFRAYVKTKDGKTIYSTASKCALGTEPQPIKMNWTEVSGLNLPSSVKVYKTEDKLNGRNFNAWYAVADMSKGEVEFRVVEPGNQKVKTVDAQFADHKDCVVMANGGYFYWISGSNYGHVGITAQSGVIAGDISSLYAPGTTADPQYFVTRGVFGVDKAGKPGVYWAGNGWAGPIYRFYDRPIPSVAGDDPRQPQPSATFPTNEIKWEPWMMVSAAPVLLKDGKCPFDFTKIPNTSWYYTNYEMTPTDIFGSDIIPDRTALGYTADGKIIIFVCDGRIDKSKGASLTELAMIMKGIGCVDALNIDGGGSTAMIADGQHLNYTSGTTSDGMRAVLTCVGFFKKK